MLNNRKNTKLAQKDKVLEEGTLLMRWGEPLAVYDSALTEQTKEWPRKEFFYWTDDGNLCGLRYNRWKIVFMEQRGHGFEVWQEPLVTLRLPKLFCLRTDPFERADHEAIGYSKWRLDRVFVMVPAQAFVAQHLASYKEFPPRQKPGSFALDDVLSKLQESSNK